jgi:hypothetical protein
MHYRHHLVNRIIATVLRRVMNKHKTLSKMVGILLAAVLATYVVIQIA